MRIALHSVYREGDPAAPSRLEFLRGCAAADRWGRHQLVGDPADAEAVLVTEVWRHADKPFYARVRRSPVVRACRGRAFCYCDADVPVNVLPGVYPSVTRRAWDPATQASGPYLTPVMRRFEGVTGADPVALFGFRGSATNHVSRARICRLRHARGLCLDTSTAWRDPADGRRESMEREYVDSLLAAKFVLCPRGVGASSYRIFEAMAIGRVPVIVSDDWVEPVGVDWAGCSVRVAERDVGRIPALLEAIESRWVPMAAAATKAYADHFSTGSVFNWLGDRLAELLGRRGERRRLGRPRIRAAASEAAQESRVAARAVFRWASGR